MDKVPDRGSPSRSTPERRGSFIAHGRFTRTTRCGSEEPRYGTSTLSMALRLEYGPNLNARHRDPSGTVQFSFGFTSKSESSRVISLTPRFSEVLRERKLPQPRRADRSKSKTRFSLPIQTYVTMACH